MHFNTLQWPTMGAVFVLCCSVQAQVPNFPFIKGIYGNPPTLIAQGYRYDSLGVNAIFIRSESLNQDILAEARAQKTLVFVEFPLLNGKSYLRDHPDAWPINEQGKPAPPADWFMGICPSHEGFKQYRTDQLKKLLTSYEVDGIWLDYVHWHAQFETPDPILPETCFCARCIVAFQNYSQRTIPKGTTPEIAEWILTKAESAWRSWRSTVILDWVTAMKSLVKAHDPQIALGVFHCGWTADDHQGALYKNLGLNIAALASIADGISPMLFHQLKARPVEWIAEYLYWLKNALAYNQTVYIWPIIQAHNQPGIVTAIEFKRAMELGRQSPSSGIMMFSDQALIQDKLKIAVMRDLYRQ